MMHNQQLLNALRELRDIQYQAASWNEGPLLVLAGPGSGKTRVLTCRIARLLEESQEKSFRVMGLTFTNKAADEMRDRVDRLVPQMGHRLFLGTFHSFCADVLRQHGGHVGISPDFRVYSSDDDLLEILRDALAVAGKEGYEIDPRDESLLPVIKKLKAELIPPEQAADHFRDESIRQRIETIYRCFEQALLAHNALDFDSLIYYCYVLFRKYPAIAKRYRTVYPYWCIDEFQDTNRGQYTLLKTIAGCDFQNLFVVADDDQIIYQWNGASHQRLEQLKTDFHPEVIQLPTNYRCPPEIVDLANRLIRHNVLRTPDKQPLCAVKPRGGDNSALRVKHFQTDQDEARWIAGDIAKAHISHLDKTVVLARNRRLLEVLEKQFSQLGVKSVISQRRDSFASTPFIWLHACLKQCNHRSDSRNIEIVAGSFRVLTSSSVDIPSLVASAKSKHNDYLREWAETIRSTDERADIQRVASEILSKLVQARDFTGFIDFSTSWFDSLAGEEGSSQDKERFVGYEEDKRAWREIYRDISASLGSGVSVDSFLQELELRSKEPSPDPDCVKLMTIHAAKGKEFDYVYLMGLAEEQIPSYQSLRRGDDSPDMEEERRNCFVAITRSMSTLTLTYADSYFGWRKPPSRFLAEMGLCETP